MSTPQPTTTVLAYQQRNVVKTLPPVRKDKTFRLVLRLWFIPLAVGLSIFAAAEIDRAGLFRHGQASDIANTLASLGLMDILIGTLCAGVGVCYVYEFFDRRKSDCVDRWTEVTGPVFFMLGLLASNFIVAFFVAKVVLR